MNTDPPEDGVEVTVFLKRKNWEKLEAASKRNARSVNHQLNVAVERWKGTSRG